MCGDSQNAIVGLKDGTVVCARYRKNSFVVYAEVLAFYLSRLLKMDCLPEVVLVWSTSTSRLWREVDTSVVSWDNNETVSLMRQIKSATFAPHAPRIIREAYLKGQLITSDTILNSNLTNPRDIADVIQWGTMIVFDSLVGHYDRFRKWEEINQYSSTGKVHNCLKSYKGKLWLIDHEKTFFYRSNKRGIDSTFRHVMHFHDKMLKTMCVFQSSLVEAVLKLATSHSPFQTLWNYTRHYEPLLDSIQRNNKFALIATLFNRRLGHIVQWIKRCNELHTGGTL